MSKFSEAVAVAMTAQVVPITCYGGTTKLRGPAGSPKRNQERAIKRMARRSRAINRMRGK